MAATKIIGVDFSGAQADNKTWVAQGRLDDAGVLRLDSVQPMIRADLHDLLTTVKPPAVAAMDFPFGVPQSFIGYLNLNAPTMTEVWNHFGNIAFERFDADREAFIEVRRENGERPLEPKRAGDRIYPESLSPLNRRIRPMTYHGIAMLHRLYHANPQRWHVPPLNPGAAPDHTVTLLEVMPGAFLNTIGFVTAITKMPGYKNSAQAIPNRDRILAGLSENSGIPLPNLATVRNGCRANDDCLDAVIAAVAAAAWAKDPSQFRHPQPDELAMAQLEGWIYAIDAPDPN